MIVSSINRNILECKVRMRKNIAKIKPVLIETYWNVKERLYPRWSTGTSY